MTGVGKQKCAVVILAAGSGQRLGHGMPKARVLLAGEPLLAHAVRGVLRAAVADELCIAVPAGDAPLRDLCAALALEAAAAGVRRVHVVDGGAERDASVRAALASLDAATTRVLIHDAARPLTPAGVFDRVVAALVAGAPAVIPVVPVTDTIKTVAPSPTPGSHRVTGTPARESLRAVQTPQGFAVDTLRRAHAPASAIPAPAVTDDAMLVEALGEDVLTVPGSPYSLKITTPTDLLLAEAMLAGPLSPRWIEG